MIRLTRVRGRVAAAATVAAIPILGAIAGRPTLATPQQPPRPQPGAALNIDTKIVELPAGKMAAIEKPIEPGPAAAGQLDPALIWQLTPTFRAELRSLTAAAGPTPAQRREIAVEVGMTVKRLARVPGGNNGKRVVGRPLSLRRQVRDAMIAAAKGKLTDEQFDRFQQELARKAEDRREVVLLSLMVRLDQLLTLTPDQRDRILGSLRSRWNEQTYPQVELLEKYEQLMPAIPDDQLNPFLTDDQRKVWRATQKTNFGAFQVLADDDAAHNLQEEDPDIKAALADGVQP